jgi:tetratricopeptide (TPR) repeat protein
MAATKKNDSWASHNNLGAVYLEKAMKSEDTELLEKAVTQFELANRKQENAQSYNNLASIYLVQGNVDKAAEAVSKALSMNPSTELSAEINGVKGLVELRQGNYDAAIRSLSSSKESSENLYNKGLAQLLSKDYQNALTTFGEVTQKDNGDAMAHYAAAIASARLGNADQAIQHLGSAAQADAAVKGMAAMDLEFLSIKSAPGFIEALK